MYWAVTDDNNRHRSRLKLDFIGNPRQQRKTTTVSEYGPYYTTGLDENEWFCGRTSSYEKLLIKADQHGQREKTKYLGKERGV